MNRKKEKNEYLKKNLTVTVSANSNYGFISNTL